MRSLRHDDKCKDCIYDPCCGGGTWREQIAARLPFYDWIIQLLGEST